MAASRDVAAVADMACPLTNSSLFTPIISHDYMPFCAGSMLVVGNVALGSPRCMAQTVQRDDEIDGLDH